LKFQPITPRLCAALFALLFTAFVGAGTPALGQATTTTTNENIPFTSTLANLCNGDQVTFSGTMHVTNTVTYDASGGIHLRTHVNYQDVSGTGTPSGNSYRVGTVSNETLNDPDGEQSEMTVIQTVKLITQGPALNYFIKFVFHVTVNANGETTSSVLESKVECRGQS
jgi:hypothetical protein